MENPSSSCTAKLVSYILIITITLSIVLFCFETAPEFQAYGESTLACEKSVRKYCQNKLDSPELDPGCFVHPSVVAKDTSSAEGNAIPLSYFCDSPHCFGQGYNFGAGENYTCKNSPFRTQEQLPEHWIFDVAPVQKYNICSRPECSEPHHMLADLTFFWTPLELFVGAVFTAEALLRVVAAGSPCAYAGDPYGCMDLGALLPFYVELGHAAHTKSPLDFTFNLSNGSGLMFVKLLKMFRMFKMVRHLRSTTVLRKTIKRSWRRLAIPMFILFLSTMFFAVLFWVLEQGTECIVGEDKECQLPDGTLVDMSIYLDLYPEGKRILLNHDGEETDFPDAQSTTWLAIVTMTTVGYGGVAPRTREGKAFNLLVMLFGHLYLAMPFTIIGSQFHEEYAEHQKRPAKKAPPPPPPPPGMMWWKPAAIRLRTATLLEQQ